MRLHSKVFAGIAFFLLVSCTSFEANHPLDPDSKNYDAALAKDSDGDGIADYYESSSAIASSSSQISSSSSSSSQAPVIPVHLQTRTMDSLQIRTTEVTLGEWLQVMGIDSIIPVNDSLVPVTGITYHQAALFCNLLSTKDKLTPAYEFSDDTVSAIYNANSGWRMPSPEEWELMARAGNKTSGNEYPWGMGAAGADSWSWYLDNSLGYAHQVAQLDSNALGIYDIAGNVWEWTNGTSAEKAISKGGSFTSAATDLAIIVEKLTQRNASALNMGFRLVRTQN